MNQKQKFGYTVLGALIMLVGIGVGSIVSPPLVAQRDGVFGEIECTKLKVVDKTGKTAIVLAADTLANRVVVIFDRAGEPAVGISASGLGNSLGIYGKARKQVVSLRTDEDWAEVDIYGDVGIHDKAGNIAVGLSADEDGGDVAIYSKAGKTGIGLSAGEEGHSVLMFNQTGKPAIGLVAIGEENHNIIVFDKTGSAKWLAH